MITHVQDYPRPQLRREKWVNLNGSWDFAFDDGRKGFSERWNEGFTPDHKILVPFTYETEKSGIHDETVHPQVWYQRTFTVDEEDLQSGKRVLLHLEGSDYRTFVYVNGSLLRVHEGGYSRFSADVTDAVHPGNNDLTVCVQDSLDVQQPRGKQRWEKENFACWYVQTTGIWKTVWLETVSAVHLERLKLTPHLSDVSLEAECEIAGIDEELSAEEKPLRLRLTASFEDITVNVSEVSICRNPVNVKLPLLSARVSPEGVRRWTPDRPDLYDLKAEIVAADGSVLDEVFSYFGMREVTIEGSQVLLNGARLYQRLILDQGYWKGSGLTPPSEQALIDDIDHILALGYNGLRKHQKTEDERFLFWCDVKGMLVWSETPAAYVFTDKAEEAFTREWLSIVRQNYSHPCIITWTPFNESWGVPQIRNDERQQEFVDGICALTRSIDPYRPVVSNDGWEQTDTDLLTIHDYVEKGEDFTTLYHEHWDEILDGEVFPNGSRPVIASGYEYAGQPVLLTEYGGIAFAGGATGAWGYGNTVKSEEEFLRRFASITMAIKNTPWICGYCYTQVSDVQQEINGLMDEDHRFKVDPEKIRKINLASPGTPLEELL